MRKNLLLTGLRLGIQREASGYVKYCFSSLWDIDHKFVVSQLQSIAASECLSLFGTSLKVRKKVEGYIKQGKLLEATDLILSLLKQMTERKKDHSAMALQNFCLGEYEGNGDLSVVADSQKKLYEYYLRQPEKFWKKISKKTDKNNLTLFHDYCKVSLPEKERDILAAAYIILYIGAILKTPPIVSDHIEWESEGATKKIPWTFVHPMSKLGSEIIDRLPERLARNKRRIRSSWLYYSYFRYPRIDSHMSTTWTRTYFKALLDESMSLLEWRLIYIYLMAEAENMLEGIL